MAFAIGGELEMKSSGVRRRPTDRHHLGQSLAELRFRRTAEANERAGIARHPAAQPGLRLVGQKNFRIAAEHDDLIGRKLLRIGQPMRTVGGDGPLLGSVRRMIAGAGSCRVGGCRAAFGIVRLRIARRRVLRERRRLHFDFRHSFGRRSTAGDDSVAGR